MASEPAPPCVECGRTDTQLVTGLDVYPNKPHLHAKKLWRCECGAYVGCHAGTEKALGYCGGPLTREARIAAHLAFDPLWEHGLMPRHEAYRQLAVRMGMEPGKCHISQMNEATAWQAHYEAHAMYEELEARRCHAKS